FGLTSGRLEFLNSERKVVHIFLLFLILHVLVHSSSVRDLPKGAESEPASRLGRYRLPYDPVIGNIVKEDEITEELKNHLIDLYFTWEQPWYQVVNERLF